MCKYNKVSSWLNSCIQRSEVPPSLPELSSWACTTQEQSLSMVQATLNRNLHLYKTLQNNQKQAKEPPHTAVPPRPWRDIFRWCLQRSQEEARSTFHFPPWQVWVHQTATQASSLGPSCHVEWSIVQSFDVLRHSQLSSIQLWQNPWPQMSWNGAVLSIIAFLLPLPKWRNGVVTRRQSADTVWFGVNRCCQATLRANTGCTSEPQSMRNSKASWSSAEPPNHNCKHSN